MHLDSAAAQARPEEVELDIRMVGEQAHRNRRIRDLLGEHQGGKSHAEGVVMAASLPDGDLVSLPGLNGADGCGLRG